MNSNRLLNATLSTEQRLSDVLSDTVRYIPLLGVLLAVGLLAIYAISSAGLLGEPDPQLLVVAASALLAGLAHLPIATLARRGRGELAFSGFWLLLALWGLSLVLFWQGALPVAIVVIWLGPLTGLVARAEQRRLITVCVLSAILTGALVWLDARSWLPRLTSQNAAGLAALMLLASTVILFALGTIIARLFQYRTLQSRLVVSFVLLLAVPVLFTTAFSAINAFTNSQSQFTGTLQAISSLKQGQIKSTIDSVALEVAGLEQGSGSAASLLHVLNKAGEDPASYSLHASQALTLLGTLKAQYPASQYQEVLVLDLQGNVILATYPFEQGLNFADESFVREGRAKFYAEVVRFPGKLNTAGDYKLVAAAPLYGDTSQDIRGIVVAVAKSNIISSILGSTSGLAHAQTYLVGTDSKLITDIPGSDVAVTAWPLVHTGLSHQNAGADFYTNYQGLTVLGYGAWDPTLNAVIATEIPRSDVFTKATSTLLVSGLVGLFAIIIAAIAAISTSRAISEPILKLAAAARTLAIGDLSSRAPADQTDEVGNLSQSFNAMADQLQGVIGNLEQRIAERTEALEQQTARLRAAAEVARDAASVPGLDELLDQAARLMLDRFGFYHTGIFLLDEKREYAVLRASPSEAGKRMLENQHRLRVGEQGIVGRVAASGEPRIALDTGLDPVYFSNPLLPNTHSEMALPLKTAEGTIGVIDIQSDQPEAFTQDDIAIVQVMADQLATAIQRTLLLRQVRAQLQQLEESQQSFTKQSWQAFSQAGRPNIGYRFDNVRLEAIKRAGDQADAARAEQADSPEKADGHLLEVPVRLRGQTIGVVHLRFQSAHVPEATATMIQQIADRLATALENARLLEESQRQASKERAIGEITSKISASVNMRNVLQTAVEELGRAIPGSDVMIQFQPDTEIR